MERKRKLDVGTDNGFSPEPDTKQVKATVNPYTGVPYSQKYHAILDKRQGAPGPLFGASVRWLACSIEFCRS